MLLTASDVPALVRGAALFGSGGGGDTRDTAILLSRSMGQGVELLDPERAPDDMVVVPVGLVGATSVLAEELPGGAEFTTALRAVERWTGTRAQALASIEAAGANALTALLVATDVGLPVVDVDLCGRALPRLDQFSIAVDGLPLTPLVLCPPGGSLVVLDHARPVQVERTVRSVLGSSGGWAAVAFPPMPLEVLRRSGTPTTTRRCLDVGRRLLDLPEAAAPARLEAATGGRVLGAGRVVEVVRSSARGFGRGSLTLRDRRTSGLLRLEMENEYLVAFEDGTPVATTPDVIAVLERRSLQAISCDRATRGSEVIALHLPGPAFWRDAPRLDAVAPRAFGIDVDPVLLPAAVSP
ncbi:DUF917 domain-containing protein [Kineococcus sp. GCM10028916]|uniref:DUF917 domain-containing protein n=1 Tax=Kineococcus sp. GCM10028916 TaxID=3273394 RepID=UPI003633F0BE